MKQSGLYKFIAVLLLLSALWPSMSWAEALRGVGIVITLMGQATVARSAIPQQDRKSTRLNSSHLVISYAVFCLKKKKKKNIHLVTQHFYKKLTRHDNEYRV